MHNMKFRIESPEHSEQIQRELFRLGFDWFLQTSIPKHTEQAFLHAKNGEIYYYRREEEGYFNSVESTETTLEELKNMKV